MLSELSFALWKKYLDNNLPENIRAWLYATADNMIRHKYREIFEQRNNTIPYIEEQYDLPYTDNFVFELENREISDNLYKLISDSLTDDEKLLMNLVYNEEMKLTEASKYFNSSYDAVRQKHYRTINKIKKIVKNKKIF